MKALVDNSVLHHAVQHKGSWESSGTVMWGGERGVEVDTGRLRSSEEPIEIKRERGGPQGAYIAALALALKRNQWEAHTSDALTFERLHHPTGRFSGVNHGDISWFKDVNCRTHTTLEGFSSIVPSKTEPIQLLRQFLDAKTDEEYIEIRSALEEVGSKKSSQDAWHVLCVRRLGLQTFLTCDTKLIGQVKSIPDRALREHILDDLALPCDLCKVLNLEVIG